MQIELGTAFQIIATLSGVTFLLFAFDKLMAKQGGWRIAERHLLTLCTLGGWLGGLAAILLFRHKIRKAEFMSMFVLSVLINLGLLYLLSFYRQ